MNGLIKRVFVFGLLSAGLVATPGNAAALGPRCSSQYALCLNSALQSEFEELGSIECAAEYVGCTARKLKFW